MSDIFALKGQHKIKAINSLPVSADNAELFLKLSQNSKGTAKTLALTALAQLEYAPALPMWQKLYRQADKAEAIFIKSCADDISRLIAPDVRQFFEGVFTGRRLSVADCEAFHRYLCLMLGKSSDEMLEIYWLIADNADKMDKWVMPDCFGAVAFFKDAMDEPCEWAKIFPILLGKSIIINRQPKLIALAQELYKKHGGAWRIAVFVADLMTLGAKAVFGKYAHLMDEFEYVLNGLALVHWDNATHCHQAICDITRHGDDGAYVSEYRSVAICENLDERWFDVLMTSPHRTHQVALQAHAVMGVLYGHYDQMLGELLPDAFDDNAIKERLVTYFQERWQAHDGTSTLYLDIFRQLGVPISEAMFLKHVQCKHNAVSNYSIETLAKKYLNWDKKRTNRFVETLPKGTLVVF